MSVGESVHNKDESRVNRRTSLLVAFAAALVVYAISYFGTLSSIVATWWNNVAYSHGFLILPISLWLVWRQRAALADIEFRPSFLGVAGLIGLTIIWTIARAVGVQVVEQFAAVAMIPLVVVAILGVGVGTTLLFPLCFLLFLVPFAQGLLPVMMQITADVSTWALHLSGLPVYRDHMYLTIPYGKFEIAKACGGLKYVITGLVLGALYSHLTYRKPWKRAFCMLVFLIVPILANALRVYIIVVVSYLTEFKFGPGAEHVEFGRYLFLVVMLALFWFGRRWADPEADLSTHAALRPTISASKGVVFGWVPVVLATASLAAGPVYYAEATDWSRERFAAEAMAPALPAGEGTWRLIDQPREFWKPHYGNAVHEVSGGYAGPGGAVEVFVAVYGLGGTLGGEMITYDNVLSTAEHDSLLEDSRKDVRLRDDTSIQVREVVIRDQRGTYLVWQWFMVGDKPALNPFEVKMLEALALVSQTAHAERVVTLATLHDHDSRARLMRFVTENAVCVRAGFLRAACGP